MDSGVVHVYYPSGARVEVPCAKWHGPQVRLGGAIVFEIESAGAIFAGDPRGWYTNAEDEAILYAPRLGLKILPGWARDWLKQHSAWANTKPVWKGPTADWQTMAQS